MSVFDNFTKESLTDYLNVCKMFAEFDLETAYQLSLNAIKYYRGDKSKRSELRIFRELEAKWYSSLNNAPDYSIYDDKYFICDLWACWVVYSRKYLKAISSPKSLFGKSIVSDIENVRSVLDLGCGFGYTTAALKELYPEASIYGTNIETSSQWRVASFYGELWKFNLLPDFHTLKKIDLVFASEYFEHIETPIDHLEDIIKTLGPDAFIIANSFNTISIGHFNEYKVNSDSISGKRTSRLFNNCLRDHHYEKVKTKCWNNRPAYWKKIKPLYESGDIL